MVLENLSVKYLRNWNKAYVLGDYRSAHIHEILSQLNETAVQNSAKPGSTVSIRHEEQLIIFLEMDEIDA